MCHSLPVKLSKTHYMSHTDNTLRATNEIVHNIISGQNKEQFQNVLNSIDVDGASGLSSVQSADDNDVAREPAPAPEDLVNNKKLRMMVFKKTFP